MTTIAHSTGVLTPSVVNGWRTARDAGTLVHPVLGREDPDVTLRPASLRRGTLTCVFADEAQAIAAEQVMATPQVLVLEDADRVTVSMSFVVAGGEIEVELDKDTSAVWVLSVPFQEVLP